MKKPEPTQPPTVAIALFAAFFLSAGFIAIAAIVLPGILLMLLAGFGFLLFFVAQYFLWARWLYPIVQRMEQEKDSRKSSSETT